MTSLRTFAFAALCLPMAAMAADLTITVKDVRDASGAVFLAVYDSDATFMKPALAKFSRKVNAAKGEIRFVFHDVPAGRYAVSSYHDQNGNGKLDTNSFGMPTEGVGFSNDAPVSGGPPAFSQAAFESDGKSDKSIAFSLNYF